MKNSLRVRFSLIFIGLAISPILLGLIFIAPYAFSRIEEESRVVQSKFAEQVSIEVSKYFEERKNELFFLDEIYALGTLEPDEQQELLSVFLLHQRIYQEIALLDAEGQEQIRLSRDTIFRNEDLRSRAATPEFLSPFENKDIYFSAVRFDETLREPLITISIPLEDRYTGEIVSVLVAEMRFKVIWDLLSEIDISGEGIAYIVDQLGQVVAHKNPAVVLSGTIVELPEEDTRTEGLSGNDVVLAMNLLQLGEQRLIVVVEQPADDVLKVVTNSLNLAIAILFIVFILAAGLAILIARQVVAPINLLAESAKAISAGDLSQRVESTSQDEVGQLASTFNQMTSDLQASRQKVEQHALELESKNEQLQHDIKKRMQAEQALSESEAQFRTLFESSSIGIGVADQQGNLLIFNETMRRDSGYSIEDLNAIGNVAALYYKPEDREIALTRFHEQGILTNFQTQFMRKDSLPYDVFLSLTPIHFKGQPCIQATVQDITARVQAEAELKKYQQHLEDMVETRTAELLAANKEMEAFNYSVSHDLRAPLRHINGFIHLLLQRKAGHLDPVSEHYLNNVADASKHMGNLIDDLLQFSRTSRVEIATQAIDPILLVEKIKKDLDLMTEKREIIWDISPLPKVWGDPGLIGIVWTNLISNAVKFTNHRERTHIEIGCQSPKDSRQTLQTRRGQALAEDSNEIVFFIRDNGIGFEPQYVDKLFAVFQRLHQTETYDGTGIGLAIVKRIIHRHGGDVWAESKKGEGATFYFTLKSANNG
ncbi:MAG: HAMP domain-containing protein [Chloroflexi bacterium]|nr:HAMP domain-containing protein [Chloroflexota bacterium]